MPTATTPHVVDVTCLRCGARLAPTDLGWDHLEPRKADHAVYPSTEAAA